MRHKTIRGRMLVGVLSLGGWLSGLDAAPTPVAIGPHPAQVGNYEKLELTLTPQKTYNNPFDPCEVAIDLLVEYPSGKSLVLPAFFGQDYERRDLPGDGKAVAWCYPVGRGTWKARFAPAETGTFAIRARLQDREGESLSQAIRIECTPSQSRGCLCIGRKDPRFLEFTEGEPFFAIGQNLAFIGESQHVNVPKAEAIFAELARNGANFVRIWTCCEDWAIAIEARKSAWTRSWNRQSPIVPLPDGEGRCVVIKGTDGTSIEVSPSHRVAVRPNTSYNLRTRFKTEGATGLQVQVGSHRWQAPAEAGAWEAFEEEFTTGANEFWLGRTTIALSGDGAAWLAELSLKERAGGAELLWEAGVNRPVRGFYNPLDCFLLDQIVQAAERNGIYLMLCVLTRDLYMNSLSDAGSADYDRAITDAKDFLRYGVARWGYSTSVAAWEYFNEIDPGKPTDRFYKELGRYLDEIDIYRHLRTTSTWHPSARDCRLAALDIAQSHHYLRPGQDDFKDEVGAILDKAAFLREHAPQKPALLGEFGLATDQWGLSDYMKQDTEGVHFHNALWASAFAGPSGTAMFWWWELLDQQDAYRHYRPLAAYMEDISFAGLTATTATASDARLHVLGYQGIDRAYLWLCAKDAAWWNLVVAGQRPQEIAPATLEVEGLAPGEYIVQWWDTHQGTCFETQRVQCERNRLSVLVPAMRGDIACKITRP
ncbi:MAG: DUF5060 domain-containing protein [Sedimentisphaerales bacterium]|nr:DUF5060 domain-containing protein [Sedimentisphaerales bacterium]